MSVECALLDLAAAGKRDRPATQLRDALGIGVTQEVADAVGRVLRHQRRPLARDLLADRLQLGELLARCQARHRGKPSAFDQMTPAPISMPATIPSQGRAVAPSAAAPRSAAKRTTGDTVASALPSTHGDPPTSRITPPTRPRGDQRERADRTPAPCLGDAEHGQGERHRDQDVARASPRSAAGGSRPPARSPRPGAGRAARAGCRVRVVVVERRRGRREQPAGQDHREREQADGERERRRASAPRRASR